MSIDLPTPIDNYFAAGSSNSEAVVRCFTENAIVKDEGQTYRGSAAIRQWKADSLNKFSYTSEPLASESKDGKIIVTSRVTGNFPGSPVDLRYFFGLEGNKIASLEIIL